MKALIVYDSQFGNTEHVAQAIASGLGNALQVTLLHAGEVGPEDIRGISLLIVGSPTQRFNPTAGINQFLKNIPVGALQGVQVAAFDTRFTVEAIEKIRILAFFVRIFGYAAKPIARQLAAKGGAQVINPEGFYVKDTEGPLLEDELERARSWARKIANALTNQSN